MGLTTDRHDDLNPRDAVFLGEQLEHLLGKRDMMQSHLAGALGVDVSIISLWARGRRAVPHYRLDALAAVLDVSIEELLDGAQITRDGYGWAREAPDRGMDEPMLAHVRLPVELRVPISQRQVGIESSAVPLNWCRSKHGAGVYKRHHHGIAQVYGPVGRIADFG